MPDLLGWMAAPGREADVEVCWSRLFGDNVRASAAFEKVGRSGAVAILGEDRRIETRITEVAAHVLVAVSEPGGQPADPARTEAVLEAFRTGEFAGLRACEPAFAACALDLEEGRGILITDRFGLQPVYTADGPEGIAFGTQPRLLHRTRSGGPEIDSRAVLDLFTFEHLIGERTLARHVRLAPPGTALRLGAGAPHREAYATVLPDRIETKVDLDAVAERLHVGLRRSVAHATASSKPVVVTLSGGLDSRALLGAVDRDQVPVTAFTFGTAGDPEVRCAADVAARAGVAHELIPMEPDFLPRHLESAVAVTDGGMGARHFQILNLAERLDSEDALVLDGFGGDAWTGGHLSLAMFRDGSADRAIARVRNQRMTGISTLEARRSFFTEDFLESCEGDPADGVDAHAHGHPGELPWRACHRFDLLERQRRFIQHGPHLLRQFCNVATPFYTHEIADLLGALPARALIEQRAYLLMHSRHLPVLAAAADATRGVPVSWPQSVRFAKRVLDAGRRRLAPPHPIASGDHYTRWFRGPLLPFVRERLLDDPARFDGIVRRDTIETLIAQHANGQIDHSAAFGGLLSLGTWLSMIRD